MLHGLYEWGWVFIPIQRGYLAQPVIEFLLLSQVALLVASFACLLVFGVLLLEGESRRLRPLVYVLPGLWILVAALVLAEHVGARDQTRLLIIWGRYLVGLPAAIFAGLGLQRAAESEAVIASGRHIKLMLRRAGHALFSYAVFAGLLVAPAAFFPASILNQDLLEQLTGVPVEILRSIAGFALAVYIIRALEIFELEEDRLIEAMQIRAIQSGERDRIGQEIHDGAMQGVYSASLILNSTVKYVDNPEALRRFTQVQQVLDQVTLSLRRYMTSLRIRPSETSLAAELARIAQDPRFQPLVNIQLDVAGCPILDEDATAHVIGIVQEALANIVRHAHADTVNISLSCRDECFALTISDNGRGFNPAQTQSGFGLRTMRRHADMIGASLQIESIDGGGAAVRVLGQDRVAV
ncbi:MAG: ATP-binding protein [Caldilineaceae bacterium]